MDRKWLQSKQSKINLVKTNKKVSNWTDAQPFCLGLTVFNFPPCLLPKTTNKLLLSLFTKYANCKPLFSFEKWIGIPENIAKIKFIKKSSLNERNISALSINLKQNWTKSTWKPKKVCHGRNYLIYYRQELHPNQILYDYIVCNIKPCQTQLTLTVLYYNQCV